MGKVLPTAEATAPARRDASSRDRGPGSSVTRRRSWATVPGVSRSVIAFSSHCAGRPRRGTCTDQGGARGPAAVLSTSAPGRRSGVHFVGGRVSVTVATLLGTPSLGLTLHTPATAVDRPVAWVHVSELPDPTPFLEGGELLLTTGLALLQEEGHVEEYVRRLADAGVVALGLGTGLSHPDVPAGLVAAAGQHGLTLLEIPR